MRKILMLLLVPLAVVGDLPLQKDVNHLVQGTNQFTLDFYQRAALSPGNLVVSPYNLSTSLSMAYLGARGETADQMEGVLHYTADTPEELGAAFRELQQDLGASTKNVSLNHANGLFVQKDEGVLFLFKALLTRNYKGGFNEVDFQKPNEALPKINRWVSQQTQGTISDLLQPGSVDTMTKLVLISALYLKAPWMLPFDEKATGLRPFFLNAGSSVTAPMMRGQNRLPYGRGDDFSLLALPYRYEDEGPRLAMLILLPDEREGLADLESKLSLNLLDDAMLSMGLMEVSVQMPKFRHATRVYGSGLLKQMGMVAPFTAQADFSGINGQKNLMINDVVHQAYIEVDEYGTEASAATAVQIGLTSAPPVEADVQFVADHPFLYLILDTETGQYLFIGRVSNPYIDL